jgi:hypothetical protein
MKTRTEPTFANQLWHARKLAAEQGLEALRNPHALIGQSCHCGDCFCCAAWKVYRELNPSLSTPLPKMIVGTAIGLLCNKAVHSGDGFRQWLYPNLPEDYEVNPEAYFMAEEFMRQGKSAQFAADAIYKAKA